MKEFKEYAKWTFHHTWAIFASYVISIIVLLIIHGSFGFTMNDDGTYLSNTLMHVGSGFVLALGTGILQKELLKKYFHVSFFWVLSLIIGFVLAELIAGLVLWKLEIYRGLINIFNNTNHFPEASIFALAGLISGILQFRLLRPFYKKRFYWIVSSTLGWGLLILSTYLGLFAFLIGAILYGAITGIVFYRIMESKTQNENVT
jgi:magnesium-transporting ATPase (P-type)